MNEGELREEVRRLVFKHYAYDEESDKIKLANELGTAIWNNGNIKEDVLSLWRLNEMGSTRGGGSRFIRNR